jgi:predicted metalloprotease with PDZ domain
MSTAGREKAEHYDLIYSGGMMTAAALDLAVRAETNNQQGLEDLIRTLYLDYPKTGGSRSKASTEVLDSGDISTIASSLSGDEAGTALSSWVDGSQEIPLSDLLAKAGLRLVEETTDGETVLEIHRIDSPSEQQSAVYRTLVAPVSR